MRRRESGFMLVETMVVLGTVTLSVLGIMTAHVACARLNRTNHETTAASEAIRCTMEQVAATDTDLILPNYDAIASNDPAGSGTAPGGTFTVAEMSADSGGRRGTVEMPLNVSGQLREDLVNAELGMPRDLNGDGAIDALDHRLDFQVLPVLVRLRWKGVNGNREMRLATVLHR